jgi:hypothetical protein
MELGIQSPDELMYPAKDDDPMGQRRQGEFAEFEIL